MLSHALICGQFAWSTFFMRFWGGPSIIAESFSSCEKHNHPKGSFAFHIWHSLSVEFPALAGKKNVAFI